MVDWFDISALILASSGAFFFKFNKESIVILINLYSAFLLNLINLSYLAEYYYIVIALFEFMFIALGLSMRVKPSILIIFLISFSYNGLSFLEFNSESGLIYDNYSIVMKCLILSLVFFIFKNGVADGFNNDHNSDDNVDSDNYHRVFNRGSQ
jgi:hypothetical protein